MSGLLDALDLPHLAHVLAHVLAGTFGRRDPNRPAIGAPFGTKHGERSLAHHTLVLELHRGIHNRFWLHLPLTHVVRQFERSLNADHESRGTNIAWERFPT
jgi:hypothetical protein